ncbi:MAG: hypothetical protein ABJA02_03390 [Acidobacteriota bacterium]
MGSFLALACLVILSGLGLAASGVVKLTSKVSASILATPTPDSAGEAPFKAYRGVALRMPVAQVTEKLGAPTQRSKAGDYYAISSTESVQITYDADQTVKSVSINFTGDLKTAPTPKEVVGTDIKKDADGIMNKMVSFPKDGFWVSYTRTAGKEATIIISLQKLAQ